MSLLRDYQNKTINQVRSSIRSGSKKIMVYLPTGAGKTHIFMEQVNTAFKKGKSVLVLVRRRQIVIQTYRRLLERIGFDYKDMINMYMGSEKNQNIITVASVDTVIQNLDKDIKPEQYDVIIVDECHDCTSKGYMDVLDRIKEKYVIGYTATPFRIGRKGHKYWDDVVQPVTSAKLRDGGYLVPTRIFCPSKPDLSKVAVVAGEYNQEQLAGVMGESKVYGDIVKHYLKHSAGKSALAFCVTVEHSKSLCEAFMNAGVRAYHVDADTPQLERDKLIEKVRGGGVLCNVNVFSTGVDIPEIRTLILARPTKSLVLYLQQVGRGLRPAKGKSECLILDHGGNCLRFGSPYTVFKPQLDDMDKGERTAKERPVAKDCQFCGFLLPLWAKTCHECLEDVRTEREVKLDNAAELVEYKDETYTGEEFKKKMKSYKYILEQKLGMPPSLVRYKMKSAYGDRAESVL